MGRHTTLSVFPCLHCRLRHPQLVTTWRHLPGLPWEKKSIPEGPRHLLRWRSPRAIGGDESPFLALMVAVSVASYLPLFLKNLRLVCRFTLHSSSYFFQGWLLMLIFSSWLQFVDKRISLSWRILKPVLCIPAISIEELACILQYIQDHTFA